MTVTRKRGTVQVSVSLCPRLTLCVVLTTLLSGCGIRRGDVVTIPEDYEGWVQIFYDVPEAPKLRSEGWRNLIEVPATGIVATSSSRAVGYSIDEYFLVRSDGGREEVKADFEKCANGRYVGRLQFYSSPRKVTVFFVGDPARMSEYSMPDPADWFKR